MDKMLDLGIDGWKCDGTDPYILELAGAKGYGGPVGWQYVWRAMGGAGVVWFA